MSSPLHGNVGSVEVRELDWSKPEQREAEGGPWDYVLAAGAGPCTNRMQMRACDCSRLERFCAIPAS